VADAVKDYLAAIGRRGGQATSEAKRLAAAANGRKGGRPPKKRRKTGKPNASLDRPAASAGTVGGVVRASGGSDAT